MSLTILTIFLYTHIYIIFRECYKLAKLKCKYNNLHVVLYGHVHMHSQTNFDFA